MHTNAENIVSNPLAPSIILVEFNEAIIQIVVKLTNISTLIKSSTKSMSYCKIKFIIKQPDQL